MKEQLQKEGLAKKAKKRSAGKPHAAFDVAGDGNGVGRIYLDDLITAPSLDPTLGELSWVTRGAYPTYLDAYLLERFPVA